MDYLWLAIGAILMLMELFLVGFGFLFVGLGSITVGIAINMAYLPANDFMMQFTWFFITTGIWFAILWYPLKTYLKRGSEKEYQNMVGAHAIVVDADLKKGQKGKIRWSGTVMVARVHDDSKKDVIKKDAEVTIVVVKGNTVYVV